MEVIQLTILALLANCLGVTSTMNSTSVHESTTMTPTAFRSTKDEPLITNTLSNDLPSNLSTLTSTPFITSQLTSKTPTEAQSTQSSTSQSISYMTTVNQTSKPTTTTPIINKPTTIPSTTHKTTPASTTIKNKDNGSVGRIIAYVVGGLLLLMLIIICILLLRKRCSSYPVQDTAWAGTYPGSDEDAVLAAENKDNDNSPTKRPSLTTFLSKKKRESLLDQYSMDVQEPEGIINASLPKNEEKLIGPAEVKVENETGKETSSEARETQSQDFPSPPEALISTNDNDPAPPPPATGTEAPDLPQEVPDADPNITSLPPPPMDFLDLVNDPDFPPPLPETQA